MWSDHMIEPVCWVAVCEAVRENLRKRCLWHWIWMAWFGKILNHIIFAIASVSVLFKSSRQGVSFLKSSFKILIWIDVYFTSSLCLKVHRGPTSTLKSKRLSWHQDFQQKREKEGIQIILCQLGLRFPKKYKIELKTSPGARSSGQLASTAPPPSSFQAGNHLGSEMLFSIDIIIIISRIPMIFLIFLHLSRLETKRAVV